MRQKQQSPSKGALLWKKIERGKAHFLLCRSRLTFSLTVYEQYRILLITAPGESSKQCVCPVPIPNANETSLSAPQRAPACLTTHAQRLL